MSGDVQLTMGRSVIGSAHGGSPAGSRPGPFRSGNVSRAQHSFIGSAHSVSQPAGAGHQGHRACRALSCCLRVCLPCFAVLACSLTFVAPCVALPRAVTFGPGTLSHDDDAHLPGIMDGGDGGDGGGGFDEYGRARASS